MTVSTAQPSIFDVIVALIGWDGIFLLVLVYVVIPLVLLYCFFRFVKCFVKWVGLR